MYIFDSSRLYIEAFTHTKLDQKPDQMLIS
jgi:hypothetical protein